MNIEIKSSNQSVVNESLALFSSNGLAFNSTCGSVDLAFRPTVIGNLKKISIVGHAHNIKTYRITFFGLNYAVITQKLFTNGQNESLSIDYVAAIRIEFLETIDNKTISNVKLSLRGCFYRIPHYKPSEPRKSHHSSNAIDLMHRQNAKRLCFRVGGTLNLHNIYKPPRVYNRSSFFIFQFKKNIFIQNIQTISILNKRHQIEKIRLELLNKHRHLVKRLDLSMDEPEGHAYVYAPSQLTHVTYLQVTILKGKASANLRWSIVGRFSRMKKIVTIVETVETFWQKVQCVHSNILAGDHGHHLRKSLTPHITGKPLPIGGHFRNVLSNGHGISYSKAQTPIIIEIDFPSGIIGRLYEIGIRSSNVYRIRVQLVEVSNRLLYTLTSPHYNNTEIKNPNPRLIGFPPIYSSGIRVILLDTIDGRAPRHVKIYTNGCFHKSSLQHMTNTSRTTTKTMAEQTTISTTTKSNCHYAEWTQWRHCSVSCGAGVQTRARNLLSGTGCNGPLMDYRMCQIQPCACVLTKEFYTTATGRKVPIDNIVGYLKDEEKAVHVGDVLDTKTIVYTYGCLQFICSNIGLEAKRSSNCDHKCLYLPWSPWSSCKGPCGHKHQKGVHFRHRAPLHILVGSELCKTQKEHRSCRTPPCFGPCNLSSWSPWSKCSKTCGLGHQKRSRYYLSLQPNCTDKLKEKRDCNPQCCPSKTKPTWSEWSPWTACTQSCGGGGGGQRSRHRTCIDKNSKCKHNVTCKGGRDQVEACNTGKCPNQDTCKNGLVMRNCSNACGHSCDTLSCRSCNEPSTCVPGCVCPTPLVLNALGQCVKIDQCLCQASDGKTNLLPGQTITDPEKCQECYCSYGCLVCRPSKDCPSCVWSDWSPFGVCSDNCNGTQTRYRSCIASTIQFEYENRTCSTEKTYYKKGCAQCTCNSTTGEETCNVQCAITPDVCANLSDDPFVTYEYLPPTNGKCCGTCNRINKTEQCVLKEFSLRKVFLDDCESVNPIAEQQCLGTCLSSQQCRCCSPSKISIECIQMRCSRIEKNLPVVTIEERSYTKILSCACQECPKDF